MVALSSLLSAIAASAAALSLASALPIQPVEELFKRQSTAEIGSDEWKAAYPLAGAIPQPKQEWLDALAEVVKQGKIPDMPPATITDGWPSYRDGTAPSDPRYCHQAVGCTVATDYSHAPDGYIGISQDDGPLPPGRALNEFFKANSIAATHFYIGANVVENIDVALQARDIPNQTFGVHSWTHGYSSSQTNEELLGELGWTMQVLADMNGGRIPSFWRPPYGDVDNRVRAIAREVFGLHTVIWNQDSEDWTLGVGANIDEIQNNVQGFVDGPKSPGLIMLQHELTDGCVEVFRNVYPSMLSQNWKLTDIPGLWDFPQYKNALTGQSDVVDSIAITNTTVVDLSGAAEPEVSSAPASSTNSAATSLSAPSSSVTSSLSASSSAAASSYSSAFESSSSATRSSAAAAASSAAIVDGANSGSGSTPPDGSKNQTSAASPVTQRSIAGAGLSLLVAAVVGSVL